MYNVSVQIGLICTFSAILPLYMGALGYSFQETAAVLSMFLFSGISGVVILAPATDMLQNHFDNAPKHLLIILAAIGVAGAFSLIANSMENNFSAISISVCLISISITSGIPLALEEGASINPQKAGFSASVMISAGNLLGYGAVYLTEFLKENNNYNKACYAFLGLLSLQFIANLLLNQSVRLVMMMILIIMVMKNMTVIVMTIAILQKIYTTCNANGLHLTVTNIYIQNMRIFVLQVLSRSGSTKPY